MLVVLELGELLPPNLEILAQYLDVNVLCS